MIDLSHHRYKLIQCELKTLRLDQNLESEFIKCIEEKKHRQNTLGWNLRGVFNDLILWQSIEIKKWDYSKLKSF